MATNIPQQESPTQFNRRIGVSRERQPLTPEQFDSYRPSPAPAATLFVSDVIPNEPNLFMRLGEASGLPAFAARRLAHYITLLEKRIAALESAMHVNPAQIGVERR
jgi:hypothetical protein